MSNDFEFEFAQIKKNLSHNTGPFKSSAERIKIMTDAEAQLEVLRVKYPGDSHLTTQVSETIKKNLTETDYFILNDKFFEVINRFEASTLTSEQKRQMIADLKKILHNFIMEHPVHSKEVDALFEMLSLASNEPGFFIPEQVLVGFFTVLALIFSFWLFYRLLYKILSLLFGPR